jgi:hypothetical protein
MFVKSVLVLRLVALAASLVIERGTHGTLIGRSPFTLPPGLDAGIYTWSFDEAGNQVVKSEDFNVTSIAPVLDERHELDRRWNSVNTWCGCGIWLDATDTNNANAILNHWFSDPNNPTMNPNPNILSPNSLTGAIANADASVVAFVWNHGSSDVFVPTDIVPHTSTDISYNCGNFIAGTAQVVGFQHLDYGYMRSNRDPYTAEGSTSHTCPGATGGQ